MLSDQYYMDLTDFSYELGEANCLHFAFPTIEKLKERYSCVEDCGICLVALVPISEAKKNDIKIYCQVSGGVATFSRKKKKGFTKIAVRKIEVVQPYELTIPEREQWLWNNADAMESVQKGLDQAKAGEFAEDPSMDDDEDSK